MTSTNDGKEVKNNETSSQKGKTYYIELYKSLEAHLSEECELCVRTDHLKAAWQQIHSLCLHSAQDTHLHLLNWLQRHTAKTVLQTKWQAPSSADIHTVLEDGIDSFILETEAAVKNRNGRVHTWESQLLQRAAWFKTIIKNPWGHPVLRVLLDPSGVKPSNDEVLEWLKEERGVMLVSRLRQLVASKQCDDLALALTAAVMERTREHIHIDDKGPEEYLPPPEGSFADVLSKQAGFTTDVWDLLIDIEFVLLHKSDRRDKCIELAKQTPLATSYQLVDRLQSRLTTSPKEKRLWKNAKEVAILIAQVIIARCMVIPWCAGLPRRALFLMARELARLLPAARLPAAAAALAAPAATAAHLHTLARALDAQCGGDRKSFVCELYVRAITAGMNELERLKLKTEKASEARLAEQTLAAWFTQLGNVLTASTRIRCECVLTAFSVHPSPAMYDRINAHAQPQKYQEQAQDTQETTSEFGSWASDSRSQTNFVKTSETLNIKQTQQANVLSTAILNEGEAMGLAPELCQDLAVLLSGPRIKTLSWDMDREELLANCRTYMERTSGGTRALTTELKYLNLDPKTYEHLPEEEDNVDDLYYGIEKGYEHLVEFQDAPAPEVLWQNPIDFDESSVSSDGSEFNLPQRRSKKKTKKSARSSSSDEGNPITLAELKDLKSKKRPNIKETSQERKNTKGRRSQSKERPQSNNTQSKDTRKDTTQSKERRKDKKKEKRSRKKKQQTAEKDGVVSSSGLSQLIGSKITHHHHRQTSPVFLSECPLNAQCPGPSVDPLSQQTFSSGFNQAFLAHLQQKSTSLDPPEEAIDTQQEVTKPLVRPEKITKPKQQRRVKTLQTKVRNIVGQYKALSKSPSPVPNSTSPLPRSSSLTRTYSPTQRPQTPQSQKVVSGQTKPISDEVKKGIARLIEFRRPKTSPDKPNASPKPNTQPAALVTNAAKLQALKAQVDFLLKHSGDKIINIPKPNPSPSTTGITQTGSSPKDAQQTSTTQQSSTDNNSNHFFNEFIKSLQDSGYTMKQDPPKPAQKTKKEIKPMSKVPPISPVSSQIPSVSNPQCAKPAVQQKKVDNAPTTFARLSYMHKNKQENKSKLATEPLSVSNQRSLDIERLMSEHKLAKIKHLQDKGSITLTRLPKSDLRKSISESNRVHNAFNENPTAKPKDVTNKSQTIFRNNETLQSSPPTLNHSKVSATETTKPLSRQDEAELLMLLKQQNNLNSRLNGQPFQSSHNKTVTQTPNKMTYSSLGPVKPSTSLFGIPIGKSEIATAAKPPVFQDPSKVIPTPKSVIHPKQAQKVIATPVIEATSGVLTKPPLSKTVHSTHDTSDLRTKQSHVNKVISSRNETCIVSKKKLTDHKTTLCKNQISNQNTNNNLAAPFTQQSKMPKDESIKAKSKSTKSSENWENVMNQLLAHKTPTRETDWGPNALDMALKRDTFRKQEGNCNTKFGAPIKTQDETQNKEKVAKVVKPATSMQAQQCKTGKSAPVRAVSTQAADKKFVSQLSKQEDPFISGIPNSDYDLLEELMDDDLRQEIGELSSDEERYIQSNVAPSIQKAANLNSTTVGISGSKSYLSSVTKNDQTKLAYEPVPGTKTNISIADVSSSSNTLVANNSLVTKQKTVMVTQQTNYAVQNNIQNVSHTICTNAANIVLSTVHQQPTVQNMYVIGNDIVYDPFTSIQVQEASSGYSYLAVNSNQNVNLSLYQAPQIIATPVYVRQTVTVPVHGNLSSYAQIEQNNEVSSSMSTNQSHSDQNNSQNVCNNITTPEILLAAIMQDSMATTNESDETRDTSLCTEKCTANIQSKSLLSVKNEDSNRPKANQKPPVQPYKNTIIDNRCISAPKLIDSKNLNQNKSVDEIAVKHETIVNEHLIKTNKNVDKNTKKHDGKNLQSVKEVCNTEIKRNCDNLIMKNERKVLSEVQENLTCVINEKQDTKINVAIKPVLENNIESIKNEERIRLKRLAIMNRQVCQQPFHPCIALEYTPLRTEKKHKENDEHKIISNVDNLTTGCDKGVENDDVTYELTPDSQDDVENKSVDPSIQEYKAETLPCRRILLRSSNKLKDKDLPVASKPLNKIKAKINPATKHECTKSTIKQNKKALKSKLQKVFKKSDKTRRKVKTQVTTVTESLQTKLKEQTKDGEKSVSDLNAQDKQMDQGITDNEITLIETAIIENANDISRHESLDQNNVPELHESLISRIREKMISENENVTKVFDKSLNENIFQSDLAIMPIDDSEDTTAENEMNHLQNEASRVKHGSSLVSAEKTDSDASVIAVEDSDDSVTENALRNHKSKLEIKTFFKSNEPTICLKPQSCSDNPALTTEKISGIGNGKGDHENFNIQKTNESTNISEYKFLAADSTEQTKEISGEDIFKSCRDDIKIENITSHDSPTDLKYMRIILPNGVSLRVTIKGDLLSRDEILDQPSVKDFLYKTLQSIKQNTERKNTLVQSSQQNLTSFKVVETIDLLSDEEDEEKKVNVIKTEFGCFSVKNLSKKDYFRHQNKFSQKCSVNLIRSPSLIKPVNLDTEYLNGNVVVINSDSEPTSDLEESSTVLEVIKNKANDLTTSNIIEIDDSSTDNESSTSSSSRIIELKNLLLNDLQKDLNLGLTRRLRKPKSGNCKVEDKKFLDPKIYLKCYVRLVRCDHNSEQADVFVGLNPTFEDKSNDTDCLDDSTENASRPSSRNSLSILNDICPLSPETEENLGAIEVQDVVIMDGRSSPVIHAFEMMSNLTQISKPLNIPSPNKNLSQEISVCDSECFITKRILAFQCYNENVTKSNLDINVSKQHLEGKEKLRLLVPPSLISLVTKFFNNDTEFTIEKLSKLRRNKHLHLNQPEYLKQNKTEQHNEITKDMLYENPESSSDDIKDHHQNIGCISSGMESNVNSISFEKSLHCVEYKPSHEEYHKIALISLPSECTQFLSKEHGGLEHLEDPLNANEDVAKNDLYIDFDNNIKQIEQIMAEAHVSDNQFQNNMRPNTENDSKNQQLNNSDQEKKSNSKSDVKNTQTDNNPSKSNVNINEKEINTLDDNQSRNDFGSPEAHNFDVSISKSQPKINCANIVNSNISTVVTDVKSDRNEYTDSMCSYEINTSTKRTTSEIGDKPCEGKSEIEIKNNRGMQPTLPTIAVLKDNLQVSAEVSEITHSKSAKFDHDYSEVSLEDADCIDLKACNGIIKPKLAILRNGDEEVVLNGVEIEDPEIGTCYYFPIEDVNENSNDDDLIEVVQEVADNDDTYLDDNSLSWDDLDSHELAVLLPTNTYSKSINGGSDKCGKENRRRLRKRKFDMNDVKTSERKYRKGKNIDYPKFTSATIKDSAYELEYKRLIDYVSSVKFSYSSPFHKDYIDVLDLLKNWPIGDISSKEFEDTDIDTYLFNDIETDISQKDPMKLTFLEEISGACEDEEYSCSEYQETNFSKGFGEGSGRVMYNSKECGNISKISAATLSDVKQIQPFTVLLDNKNLDNMIELSKRDQFEKLNQYINYIHLRDKVRKFFTETTIELNVCHKFNKMGKNNHPVDSSEKYLTQNIISELCAPDFIEPLPSEVLVNVVQVGQLPVSAAAQNPVTCDPRVTQVSDDSPSQCSVENSPRDDTQSGTKTEYTELTTADLSNLPLVQSYNEQNEILNIGSQNNTHTQNNEDIPIETEVKSDHHNASNDIKEHGEFCNEASENHKTRENNVSHSNYTYAPSNISMNNASNVGMLFHSMEKEATVLFSEPKQQNGSSEKTDQLAHAMNAAGITTTPEPSTTDSSSRNNLVNILSQKLQAVSTSNTQATQNNYTKTTSINALALQQALAQILPQHLNQNGDNPNGPVTQQVLHILQSKNGSGSQITLLDNSQQSVINNQNATPVLHIVQNKGAPVVSNSGSTNVQQTNTFSGLSLVDTGLQQGGNQLLHIVNTGNQKNNNAGQVLKRVNLLTNLTNVQGSNEQKMVQFVCKSADGKAIQLNAPHQRSMVLRLHPIETPNVQSSQQKVENDDSIALSNNQSKDSNSQQEIKSRSVYEENYAKFIQNSSGKATQEKSNSLPKFNQAFGKPVFQDGSQKPTEINSNTTNLSASNNNGAENIECSTSDNAINMEQVNQQINSPPLILRKSPAQTPQAQPNLVQQIKQTISPMNIQTMHGGVIYTRQIPVNIGGGQTINLITVPSTELVDDQNQKSTMNQGEIEPSIIKIVPQGQPPPNAEVTPEEGNNQIAAENAPNAQPQPVLTQMRIKLPMLSKAPHMVTAGGTRAVRPTFFQIQRNVIGGANQPVYQQLVLTAAPQLTQQAVKLPQTPARPIKVPSESTSSESQMSSSTLEQLREFDMVLEQVKERSTVQPNGNATSSFNKHSTSTDTTDSSGSTSSTTTETTQQVLYSIGNSQPINVAYVNRKTTTNTPNTATFARSPDSSGIADSPSSSSHVQLPHTVTTEPSSSEASAQLKPKVSSKSKSRPKSSSSLSSSMKINNVPHKSSTSSSGQKPLEDEQTTQRILYILAEYKEQVENSPDKDKPAPRRRTNPPSNPGSSKRKKSSSGSRRPGRDMSPVQGDDTRTMGSEDSSCGTSQGDCTENCLDSHSPQDSPRKVARKLTFEQDTASNQARPLPQRNVIVADGQTISVARGSAGKPATAVLMPANYILPVSMMKGGQQIAIVTNRGPKLLTVGGGEAGTTNTLFLQRLIGPAGLKPVLARPGVRHVRLPTAALHNLHAFNLAATTTSVQPPDSTASPAPAPTPPELIDTRATSSPWAERDQDGKTDRGSSPEGSEPWNLPASADTHEYSYEEAVRVDGLDRTVLGDAIPDRYSPDMEAQRIFDKMFDTDSKKSYIVDDSPRCGYDIDASDDDKGYQVVHKKDGASQRHHRLTHVSAAALRHKYAILEHELRLQKSLSEECEDLGVDSPSAAELFPEAELLFAASPAHDHAADAAPRPHTPARVVLSPLPPSELQEEMSAEALVPLPALDHEEFARAHPNTTFHSEPSDEFAAPPATVLMAPQATVISQAAPDHAVKYSDIDLASVHLTRFDSILTDARELHLTNTASAIVHATGNATQVIRRVYEKQDQLLMEDAAMAEQDSGDDEPPHELFWETNSQSPADARRNTDYSSDSEKCCKSPSLDETSSWDSSGQGAHMRLDSVIKEARGVERSCSAESSEDAHPPLRTYPPKRLFHDPERSVSGKTRAGERSPDSVEVRRRASLRGVVKRGCHCCNGSPTPAQNKRPRQRKTPATDTS